MKLHVTLDVSIPESERERWVARFRHCISGFAQKLSEDHGFAEVTVEEVENEPIWGVMTGRGEA